MKTIIINLFGFLLINTAAYGSSNHVIWDSFNSLVFKSSDNVDQEIVGGELAEPGEFPFIVSIQYKNGVHFCGGSLIAPGWVLTAAHCMDIPAKKMRVLIGLHDQKDKSEAEVFAVEQIIKHPEFDEETLYFDLALIRLSAKSNFNPIKLNRHEIPFVDNAPMMAWVAGWGVQKDGSSKNSQFLMKVQLPLVDSKACNAKNANDGDVQDHMLCAGYKAGGKDSCQSDSGGPLFLQDDEGRKLQIGIVSFGDGCGLPGKFGIYTKLSYFFDWIEAEVSMSQNGLMCKNIF